MKELEYHKSKLQEKDFCSRAKHTEVFNNPRAVLEENPRIPERKEPPKGPKPGEEGGPEPLHDKAFKPSNAPKKGQSALVTIAKFPAFIPDPPVEKKRIKYADGEEPELPPGFKATYKY